ncbi:MAG: hypothetical protein JO305_00240 [Alphaproteobacteria bacterium]|nr:hypothetical protein [Alphaproteobacteria bacterium]
MQTALSPQAAAWTPPDLLPQQRTAPALRPSRVAALVVILPFIFESFHYIYDVGPLYALSKAMPILLSPLAIYGLLRYRLPATGWFLAFGLYAILVTPFLSALNFGGTFAMALAAQTHALPVSYFFSFFVILWALAPTHRELTAAVRMLGIASVVILAVLWVTVPAAMYHLGDLSKLFVYDEERHYRIYMPLFFITVYVFLEYREFLQMRRPLNLLWIALSMVALIMFDKERAAIAGLFAMFLIVALTSQGRWPRRILVFGVAALIAIPIAYAVADAVGYFTTLPESGSLTERQLEFDIAQHALAQQPSGYFIGLGTVSPLSERTYEDIFGHDISLADIGWFGILYEYGGFGVALILMLIGQALAYYRRYLAYLRDPLLQAFQDQLWYTLLTSIIYDVMLAPGEWAASFALFVYVGRQVGIQAARAGALRR